MQRLVSHEINHEKYETGNLNRKLICCVFLFLVQPVLQLIPNVIVSLGSDGVLVCRNTSRDTPFQVTGMTAQVSDHSALCFHVALRLFCT